jgi:hypothetical protein
MRLFIAAVLALASNPAGATVGPPTTSDLVGDPRVTLPGAIFSDTLMITVDEAGTLSEFSIDGQGWSNPVHNGPPSIALLAGEQFALAFQALAVDPDLPLVITYQFNQRTVRRALDLSAKSYDLATRDQDMVRIVDAPARPPHPVKGDSWADPGPEEHGASGELDRSGSRYSVTVYGTFVYTDPKTGAEQGAYGLTVSVRDDDDIGYTTLASAETDRWGDFSVTFDWSGGIFDESPDIYVRASTANDVFDVTTATWQTTYAGSTATRTNYSGTNLNIGTWEAVDNEFAAPIHVLTTLMRAQRWFLLNGNYPIDVLDARYPLDNNGTSFYTSNAIHIDPTDSWDERVIIHEMGHDWEHEWGGDWDSNYDCDDPDDSPGDCGHSPWCAEDGEIAWGEGFADWLSQVIPSTFAADYGSSATADDFENQGTCDGTIDTPELTEGSFAAFLQDLEDGKGETWLPWDDEADLDPGLILDVAHHDAPNLPAEFIEDFRARHGNDKNVWALADNLGFANHDFTDPPKPAAVNSPSHEAGGDDSANPIIQAHWSAVVDDYSGVLGYGVSVTSSPALPAETIDVPAAGAVLSYSTPVLSAGTWYINVRSCDRAGNWSNSPESGGPFDIRDPIPADITWGSCGALWDGPVILRNAPSGVDVSETTFLDGELDATYWNVCTTNGGDDPTGSFGNHIYVDGVQVGGAINEVWYPLMLDGMEGDAKRDRGPITVRGGRHIISVLYDYDHDVAEGEEGNNRYPLVRNFEPVTISPGVATVRSAPPGPYDGWEVSPPFPQDSNQDGVRIDAGPGRYDGVAIYSSDLAADYNLALHEQSTGQQDGFGWYLSAPAYSSREQGRVDLVLSNQFQVGAPDKWDVGITNPAGGSADYTVVHLVSETITAGVNLDLDMAEGERAHLFRFSLTAGRIGWNTINLELTSGTGPVRAAWVPAGWTTGSLEQAPVSGVTGADNSLSLSYEVTTAGNNCLIVWRDPVDVPDALFRDALVFDVDVRPSDPDLTAGPTVAGWHSPLVPRADDTGTPASAPLPAMLTGDQDSTYINAAVYNAGMVGSPPVGLQFKRDGSSIQSAQAPGVPPGGYRYFNADTTVSVPGGRHTLGVVYDPNGIIDEGDDTNNTYAEQYIWEPELLAAGTMTFRPAPRPIIAGWNDVAEGNPDELLYYNCDALRLDPPGASFQAMAVLPPAATDVDLRLHEVTTGPKNGFDEGLAYSGWGPGESDFVILNYLSTDPRSFDVGLLGIEGNQDVALEATASVFLSGAPSGSYGPFSLPEDAILRLHEVHLDATIFEITLVTDAEAAIDWGMSVHRGNYPHLSKTNAIEDGIVWFQGPGLGESARVAIPEAGTYVIAVWRAVSNPEGNTAGTYNLFFSEPAQIPQVSLPPAHPTLEVLPNPFGPSTSVACTLPADDRIDLSIFDVSGRLVSVLAARTVVAGRHRWRWDGHDLEGDDLGSGVYLVRLKTTHGVVSRRITILR